MAGYAGAGIQAEGASKMILWICPECGHYNEEEDDAKMNDFRCEKCSREVEDIMAIIWEIKPKNLLPPDPGHIC